MSLWSRLQKFFQDGEVRTRPPNRFRPALDHLEERCLLSASAFTQVNLASDVPGLAQVVDPNLVNPWGMATSPTGPFWFADQATGVSDLLDGGGDAVPIVVTVPSVSGPVGSPTGVVFNPGGGFVISANGVSMPSVFLFATLDGGIYGWHGFVDPTNAVLAVDNSSSRAVYTGLALATNPPGQSFLYAANIAGGKIDVFDQDFQPVTLPNGFQDPNLPKGFAPFNVQTIGDRLYVTYAEKDPSHPGQLLYGAGHGIVDVFDLNGDFVSRFATAGTLDAPWGVTLAPADFGSFGGALLIGNNGDGRVNAFDPVTGAFLGQLADVQGTPISIPGLWALKFGNGFAGGDASTLFFAAGMTNDIHGLFGAIQPPQKSGADTAGPGMFDPGAAGERVDYPLPPFGGPGFARTITESAPVSVLLPMADTSLALVPTLSAFSQPSSPGNATFSPTPLATVPLNPALTTALLTTGTIVLVPGADGSPADTRSSSFALNRFLDVGVTATFTARPTIWVSGNDAQPQSYPHESVALAPDTADPSVELLVSRAEGESLVDEMSIDKLDTRVTEMPGPAMATESTVRNEERETRDHGNRTDLLTSLLFAASVPLLGGYLVKRRRRPLPTDEPSHESV